MSTIQIYISDLKHKKILISVKLSDTIKQGKLEYQKVSKSNNPNPQWKFNGQVLKDERTFNDYGIEEYDDIGSNDRSEGGKK